MRLYHLIEAIDELEKREIHFFFKHHELLREYSYQSRHFFLLRRSNSPRASLLSSHHFDLWEFTPFEGLGGRKLPLTVSEQPDEASGFEWLDSLMDKGHLGSLLSRSLREPTSMDVLDVIQLFLKREERNLNIASIYAAVPSHNEFGNIQGADCKAKLV